MKTWKSKICCLFLVQTIEITIPFSKQFLEFPFCVKDKIKALEFKLKMVLASFRKYPRNLKWRIASLFDPCVDAMGRRPYCPSRMEVSYCTFRFGAIIRRNLCTLSLPRDSPRDDSHLTKLFGGLSYEKLRRYMSIIRDDKMTATNCPFKFPWECL